MRVHMHVPTHATNVGESFRYTSAIDSDCAFIFIISVSETKSARPDPHSDPDGPNQTYSGIRLGTKVCWIYLCEAASRAKLLDAASLDLHVFIASSTTSKRAKHISGITARYYHTGVRVRVRVYLHPLLLNHSTGERTMAGFLCCATCSRSLPSLGV